LKCVRSEEEPRTQVCLVAKSIPTLGDGDPRRLPILAIKVSTGGVLKHGGVDGVKYYLEREWKEGWTSWLKEATKGFPSVLEHVTFTFYVDGCSRVCSHQLVRHRLVSFTQESQRYTEERIVRAFEKTFSKRIEKGFWKLLFNITSLYASDLSDFEKRLILKEMEEMGLAAKNCSVLLENFLKEIFVIPPSLEDFGDAVLQSYARFVNAYARCRAEGKKMEDCRFLLPQATRTSLLATANLREWLHVIELRAHPKAQWEIRGVANAIKELLEDEIDILQSPH